MLEDFGIVLNGFEVMLGPFGAFIFARLSKSAGISTLIPAASATSLGAAAVRLRKRTGMSIDDRILR